MSNSKVSIVSLVIFVWTVVCWCPSPGLLRAQTVSGTILGVVQDPQGSAIVKAEVSVRNLDTGAVRSAVADESGNYRISSVPAGPYEVGASAAGFKTEVRSGINVTVGSDVAVNFSLTIGAINEQVQVTGEASQVDTSSATLGGFVNSATVRELPLNGRDWLQLALLQPSVNANNGVSQSDGSRAQRGNGLAMTISGSRSTDNAFRIDGLVVNDYSNSGPGSSLRVNMGVDAIQEFSVLTSNYSAEYGRGSGGIINAITKSGTNQIHGSAYEFVRNSAFDARNFFDGQNSPPFHRDQYGGAVGGPIRKDKTFFFSNYEKLGELKSLSSAVPTLSPNVHNGILCADTTCSSTTQVAIDPKILPYLALFPLPNGPVIGNIGIFAFGDPRRGEENYVIGKIDHYFSQATILNGSYTYDNSTVSSPDPLDLKLTSLPARRQNVVLDLQHIFSPTLIDTTRLGVTRTFAGNNIDGSPTNAALNETSLGFVPGQTLGNIVIPGVQTLAGLGAGGLNLFGYTAPQVYNDLSWNKGRQSIRIGASLERIDYNINAANAPNGAWTFPSIQGFLQGSPNNFQADFPGTDAIRGARTSLVAAYIQDDLRIRSNLTINLGVRYEMASVVSEVNGKIANLRNLTDPTVTVGGPYYNNPSLKNFAPRVGFAWDPFKDGKTAVRGGFGIYDIPILPYDFQNRLVRSAPLYESGVLSNPPAASFPNQGFQLLGPSSIKVTHIEFNPKPSYSAKWNLNIERQLTKSLALTVGYVGSVGVHLDYQIEDADQVPPSLVMWNGTNLVFPIPAPGQSIQRINPNFGDIAVSQWSGHSSYEALQANLVQRPVKGLTYQIAYTWSKSIDSGSSTYSDNDYLNSVGPSYAFDPRINRGVSDFDIPQNFVANFLYDLPVPASVKSHALTNTLFGGWQVGGIYTLQSGSPFGLKIGVDEALTGNSVAGGSNGGQRPNYVNAPGCNPDAVTGKINSYIMTQCFAFPTQGILGNLGRNTLRMPMFRDLDFSMFKNQNLWGEKLKMQFRVEAFNILNNTNLQAQTRTIFDGSGKLVSNIGQVLAPTVNTSRQIQFGLRLLF